MDGLNWRRWEGELGGGGEPLYEPSPFSLSRFSLPSLPPPPPTPYDICLRRLRWMSLSPRKTICTCARGLCSVFFSWRKWRTARSFCFMIRSHFGRNVKGFTAASYSYSEHTFYFVLSTLLYHLFTLLFSYPRGSRGSSRLRLYCLPFSCGSRGGPLGPT